MEQEEVQTLALRDNARQQLLSIKTIESGINYLNKVKAIEVWVKAEKKDAELQNIVAEQKIRTQRILGRLIKEGQDKGEIRNQKDNQYSSSSTKELAQVGLTKKDSHKFKAIAEIPDEVFEKEITEKKEAVKKAVSELTTAGMLKLGKEIQKNKIRDEKSKQGENLTLPQTIDLRFGDFKKVLADIPDNSIDLILTDPPYPIEFIKEWSALSIFAEKKLKPSGFLIAYSGQMNLPDVIERLSEKLIYYWTFCLYHIGQTQIVNGVNVMCRWKPILIFQKGPRKKLSATIQDYVESESRQKDGHDWQQSTTAVKKLLEAFSEKGDLICDPFTGSGTTAICCQELKRKFIGAEIEEKTFNIAKGNLQ